MEEDRAGTYQGLQAIVARLRGQEGCPWDREQTHASLRRNLLEEGYEALDALDRGDPAALAEELGDVLVQVAFHVQIATEAGEFTGEDVLRGAAEKLVRRHPHVFGDVQVRDAREVERNWEAIKGRERGEGASLLGGVPLATPALAFCQAISRRAAAAGFEWAGLDEVLDQVAQEMRELGAASTPEEREHEMGDLLFSVANLARWLGLDAEAALRESNRRFYRRFTHMEREARSRGTPFASLPRDAKEALWAEAKEAEREGGAG